MSERIKFYPRGFAQRLREARRMIVLDDDSAESIALCLEQMADDLATAERRGAERGLRQRVAAMSVGDCKVLESRILRINADVPYIASEEGFAARIRAAVLAALFPSPPEPS